MTMIIIMILIEKHWFSALYVINYKCCFILFFLLCEHIGMTVHQCWYWLSVLCTPMM